ncbi:MAG: GDP-L-fucose synthase [Phycisphaerae bacterium]|nr:GDP-L-fucose synthase [Phycisphaerae bacterium]MCZ2398695.1 GDP-L-fucose synthase [Phycisphaerae bacterium]
MDPAARIYVAGHGGLVGSAILRRLRHDGFAHLITRTRAQLDLTDRAAVEAFFHRQRPEYVFLAAARVGGIVANGAEPADFIRDNLLIQAHVIDAACRFGVRKLLFLGSSCIYPRLAPQPIREESLLTGPLEPTNSAYAVAKIAGLEQCAAYHRQHGFRSLRLMPTNLYGPHDNFDPQRAHVLAALLRRFHEARVSGAPRVVVWGTGTPRREFLHVDDLAEAAVFLMRTYDGNELLNVGTGVDVSIAELAQMVRDIVGYRGQIVFDPSRPDGTPRKLLDISRITALGWQARTPLHDGLRSTYQWYTATLTAGRSTARPLAPG